VEVKQTMAINISPSEALLDLDSLACSGWASVTKVGSALQRAKLQLALKGI
jgi:hypothetical protein